MEMRCVEYTLQLSAALVLRDDTGTKPLSDYVGIIVDSWATEHALRLCRDVPGYPREHYFAYLSSTSGERCQIEIGALMLGVIVVHVRDIESADDDCLCKVWHVRAPELASTLYETIALIERWFGRHLKHPAEQKWECAPQYPA